MIVSRVAAWAAARVFFGIRSMKQLSLFDSAQDLKPAIELAELFEAYFNCRNNKRNTLNALAFEVDYEANLLKLCAEINNGSYRPGKEQEAAFLSSMNSYLGIMKHYKTHKLRKRMLFKKLSGWWWDRVYLSGGIAKFVLKIKPMKSKHRYQYTNN